MVSYGIAAVAAGFAFVVSLITGIISGVGFLSILMRAFIAGLAFALLTAALEFLSRMIFPDLFTVENSEDSSAEGEPVVEAEKGESGGQIDITVDDSEHDTQPDPESAESSGFVEEIGRGAAPEQGEPVFTSAAAMPSGDDSVDSMEELPSMEGLGDSFEASYGEEESAEAVSSIQSPGEVDVLGEMTSPGDVARAVQTIMKRDQEG